MNYMGSDRFREFLEDFSNQSIANLSFAPWMIKMKLELEVSTKHLKMKPDYKSYDKDLFVDLTNRAFADGTKLYLVNEHMLRKLMTENFTFADESFPEADNGER